MRSTLLEALPFFGASTAVLDLGFEASPGKSRLNSLSVPESHSIDARDTRCAAGVGAVHGYQMRENFMRLIGATSILVLICAISAQAAELPSRKPGLWEVKTSIEGSNAPVRVVQQCIDATTDQMMQSSAGPFAPAACPERDVQRSANSITIDSVCTVGGKTATAHSVVNGSFDSAYTMTVTSHSDDILGGKMIMTMEAKWLGLCTADQKPGDLVMGNGMKINLPEMQKRGTSPAIPLPPR
jgi:hypothetical protein